MKDLCLENKKEKVKPDLHPFTEFVGYLWKQERQNMRTEQNRNKVQVLSQFDQGHVIRAFIGC